VFPQREQRVERESEQQRAEHSVEEESRARRECRPENVLEDEEGLGACAQETREQTRQVLCAHSTH